MKSLEVVKERSVLKAVYVDIKCSPVRQNVAVDSDAKLSLYLYFVVCVFDKSKLIFL